MWLRTGSVRKKRTSPYVEILAEASTAADGILWRELSDFSRSRSATFGFTQDAHLDLKKAVTGYGVNGVALPPQSIYSLDAKLI